MTSNYADVTITVTGAELLHNNTLARMSNLLMAKARVANRLAQQTPPAFAVAGSGTIEEQTADTGRAGYFGDEG